MLNVFNETLYEHTEKTFDISGSFNKKILLLAINPSEAEITLLQNMLKACKLTMDDCILHNPNTDTDVIALIQQLKPAYILAFGVSLKNDVVHVHNKQNQPFTFAGIHVILTSDLGTLSKDTKIKADLWLNALQPLFVHA